ncbi:MAG TPA: 16S rRNA (cytosine(1402)-N(4))-methyltransferase RsmH [Syntrophomonadaceae bacterium]|nr:16S rRNA (cytosine(1402)-N(4))-methyltransferase RsmH [Syntrophomonadaceae bacterium]
MHLPVLLTETIDNLVTDPKGIYIDCTLGGGGHLKELLNRLDPEAKIIAIDKDKEILQQTEKAINADNVIFVHADFKNISEVIAQLDIDKVNGIVMDLGVSSFQLDQGERGFSFHEDAALDMRMNREQELNAAKLVNTYSEEDIADILWKYGEERYSRRIARAIIRYRAEKRIETTLELVEIIRNAVPASYRREKHPGRKSFQAIRIAVNGELDALIDVLPQAVEALLPDGKICIITFHSLEDRIVKHFFQEKSKDCICPPGLPICICDHQATLKLERRKPFIPDEIESNNNKRARSAKLRVATKI